MVSQLLIKPSPIPTSVPDAHPVALVLPGSYNVHKKQFSTILGIPKSHGLRLCNADRAHEYTGYVFGGTSPFGLRRHDVIRVFIDSVVRDMAYKNDSTNPNIWINGGGLGLVVRMNVEDLFHIIEADGGQVVSGVATLPQKH